MSATTDHVGTVGTAAEAASVLAAGGLVGLPTETVYGLAADARNRDAIRRVFQVKGRPVDHPVIVHLADVDHLDEWVTAVPAQLRAFAARHWPGPLTIIASKQPWVLPEITGGLDTVAVRVPGAPLARQVIAQLATLQGRPAAVVAPSANLFGQVSPTTVDHVCEGLTGRLLPGDAVLDGGPCAVGVESTIVAWLDGQLTVLRPGAVTLKDSTEPAVAPPGIPAVRAPGMLPSHYAPRARVILAHDPNPGTELLTPVPPVGLLAPAEVPTPEGWTRLAAPTTDSAYAEVLYAALRAADTAGLATIVAVPPAAGELRAAILDRLSRASKGSIPSAQSSRSQGPDRPR